MKKKLLLAVLLIGAGVATSRAGVAFGISIDSGRDYVRGGYVGNGCAQPAYGSGYGYSGQYRYTPDYGYAYVDGPHDALHHELREQHRDLHHDLREQHADRHYDLRRQHEAVHRDLREQRYYGVPAWEIHAQHRAAHEALHEQHVESHEALREQHDGGHENLRQQHRAGHYDLGW